MRIALFANTDWYLYNFRLSLARSLQADGHDVLLLSPPGPYTARILATGLRWTPAPLDRRSLNPFRELRLVLWLRQMMTSERIDLIHGFTIKCAVYGAVAARLSGDRARVAAIAGLGYVFSNDSVRARLLRPLVLTCLRIALGGQKGRVILQNRDDAKLLLESGAVSATSLRLIAGSGVDCSRFKEGAPRSTQAPLRVLLAARLIWDKGILQFTQASRMLRAQGRQVQFLLAGTTDEGNPNSVPESKLREWQADGLVEWLGHVDDMPALLSTVDVMALPTTYGEGVPRSLLEAGACRVALVATDGPGCRDLIEDGIDGILVKPRDASSLACALARLDDDRGLCWRLGQAARAKIVADFDERIVIRKTYEVYRELIPSLPEGKFRSTGGAPTFSRMT